MATYNEARDARDAAAEIVTRHGGTVIKVAPMKRDDGWVVEVEVAKPLLVDTEQLIHAGVRIVLYNHTVRPLSERLRMQHQRPRGM